MGEKIDVIAAMHTFQLEKMNAMQEIKEAQNKTPPDSSRKDRPMEPNSKVLLQPLPPSQRQIDPLGQIAGGPLIKQGMATKVSSHALNPQQNPALVSAMPLQASCSSGAVFRQHSPLPPVASPFTIPLRSGMDSLSQTGRQGRFRSSRCGWCICVEFT